MEEHRATTSDSVDLPDATLLGASVAPSQLQAQHELLLTLFRVSARLAGDLEAPQFAVRAMRTVVEAVPAIDIAGLWLLGRADKRLRLDALQGLPDAPTLPAAALAGVAVRHGEGMVGTALLNKQPVLLSGGPTFYNNVAALDPASAEWLRPFAAQLPAALSVVALPLMIGSIPIGVLQLFALNEHATLTTDDLPLLQAFADQLAVVVRNAQMYAEMSAQHRRLQAFDTVVTAITTASDLQQMLDQALSVTLYVVGGQRGLIVLFDNDVVRVEISYQLPEQVFFHGQTFALETSFYVDVLRTGQPGVLPLPAEEPWSVLYELGVNALASVPLLAGGTVVGVLTIALDANAPAQLDWPTLAAIGNQIGIATANYQLYDAGQRERRQLAGVIASIAEGVIICDGVGRIILTNQAAEVMLGRALGGFTAVDVAEFLALRALDGRPVPPDETPLARSLQGAMYQNAEFRVTSGTGRELVISCSGAPLQADDGMIDGAVVVFRDMTAYKEHEALRDEFIAVAAHELRAPLAAVKGYTDLLAQRERQRASATEQDRRGIMLLSRQIEHLVRLVDNLLDVSRLDAGRLELYIQPADLVNLIEASIDRISIGDNNHHFIFNGPETLTVECDQVRIQQVFTNLLSNAARYSAAGTQITVDVWTEACTIEAGAALRTPGDHVCVLVAVRDQGVGMTPEVQARVFERYYRANTVMSASGLGLGGYISREIVQLHGGQIWVESAPGSGSTFYVLLPLHTIVAS